MIFFITGFCSSPVIIKPLAMNQISVWHPGIEEVVSSLDADYEEIITLPLFAFKSNNIKKSYEMPLEKGLKGKNIKLKFIYGLDGDLPLAISYFFIFSFSIFSGTGLPSKMPERYSGTSSIFSGLP